MVSMHQYEKAGEGQQPQNAQKRVDSVPVPHDLLDWAKSAEARELLKTIKDQSRVDKIDFASSRPGKGSFEIHAATNDGLRAAKALMELHLSFQVEYQQKKQQTEKMEEDLRATNEEFEKGLRVEFAVPEKLIGLVIGKQGANVQKVKEATGVDKVVVDTKTRVVRIRGLDPENVKRAREMLEFKELALPLEAKQVKIIIGDKGRNIADLCRKSGCVNINVEQADQGNENMENRVLKLIGTAKAVDLARTLIETQVEHDSKMRSLRDDEFHIKKQLSKIDSEYREFAGAPSSNATATASRRTSTSTNETMESVETKKKDEQPRKKSNNKKDTLPPPPPANQNNNDKGKKRRENNNKQQPEQQHQVTKPTKENNIKKDGKKKDAQQQQQKRTQDAPKQQQKKAQEQPKKDGKPSEEAVEKKETKQPKKKSSQKGQDQQQQAKGKANNSKKEQPKAANNEDTKKEVANDANKAQKNKKRNNKKKPQESSNDTSASAPAPVSADTKKGQQQPKKNEKKPTTENKHQGTKKSDNNNKKQSTEIPKDGGDKDKKPAQQKKKAGADEKQQPKKKPTEKVQERGQPTGPTEKPLNENRKESANIARKPKNKPSADKKKDKQPAKKPDVPEPVSS